MIVLWRPPGITDPAWFRYTHAWERQAKHYGEQIEAFHLQDSQLRQQWDRVNTTHGRFVLWVRPEFIPLPSILDELQYLRGERQLIVGLQQYNAVFSPGVDRPYKWEEAGASPAFVCFQLTGQVNKTLPPSNKVADLWTWIGNNQSHVYLEPQRFVKGGGYSTRSKLGCVVLDPFRGAPAVAGRIITGGEKWVDTEEQRLYWDQLMQAWEIWL